MQILKIKHKIGLNGLQKKEKLECRALNSTFGIEVLNHIDLRSIGNNTINELKSLLKENGVLVLRSHPIVSKKEQLHLTSYFGISNSQIDYISAHAKPIKQANSNNTYISSPIWHNTHSNFKNPSHLSFFQMPHLPKGKWQSYFISLLHLYEKLDKDTKKQLNELKVMYHNSDTIHSLLWLHPFVGRPCIYFDFRFASEVYNICTETGHVLLKDFNDVFVLMDKIFNQHPEHIYKHNWNKGDIVIVDNYAIAQRESFCDLEETNTFLRRTTTEGIYF